MTIDADEREWSATERGFMLCFHLLDYKMSATQVADLLGYKDRRGAWNLLNRLRVEGLIKEENGLWYVVKEF